MKYKKITLFSIIVVTLMIAGRGMLFSQSTENRTGEKIIDAPQSVTSVLDGMTATVYKEPTCGCCEGYIAELRKQGVKVTVKQSKDMDALKKQYGITEEKQSCHTTTIGDYFVEGHVPMVALEKLLTERPTIDGIGLSGMPLGTPGMPGIKQSPYEVYQKTGSNFTDFMTL